MHTGIDVHIEGDTLIMGVSDSMAQIGYYVHRNTRIRRAWSALSPFRNGLYKAQYRDLNPSLIHWLSDVLNASPMGWPVTA